MAEEKETKTIEQQPKAKGLSERRGLTRLLVRWVVRFYYPHIDLSGTERIPRTGPVLLCGNHGNSLIDPVLIGIAAARPVRFMAKSPLFDNPILGPPMKALGMIPAYRGSDDAKQVRRNLESLDIGAKVLVDGQAMGIFPEGKSTDQAHLEMVRSGAARMAIQAVTQGAEGLLVIPIGLTYQSKDEFRTSAWVQVGEPIDVSEMLNEHDGNERKARRALTDELNTRLRDVVVHLDEPQWEPWLEDLEILARPPAQKKRKPIPPLQLRKRIADAMNYFLANDRPRAESIADQIQAHRQQVQSAGLSIGSPVLRMHGLIVGLKLLWNFFCLILLLIPAAAGTLHHLVPFVVVRTIAARMDQPGRKTISTNRMMVGVPLYLIWYAVVAWWQYGYFSSWFTWTWLATAPLMGLIALWYWRRASQTVALSWHQVSAIFRRQKLLQIRKQETELREQLRTLAEEYAKLSPRPQTQVRRSKRSMAGRALAVAIPILLIATTAWLAKYWILDKPLQGRGLDLKRLPEARVVAYLNSDEKTLLALMDGLGKLGAEATAVAKDFETGKRSFSNQSDNDDVRELMRRYLTYRQVLFRIVWKYQKYGDIKNQQLRLRAFLVDFAAAAVLYESSMRFVHQFKDNRELVAKMNEPEPNWDIPPGLYDLVRRNLASPANMKMLDAAKQYYHQEQIQKQFKEYGYLDKHPYDRLHAAINSSEKTIDAIGDSVSSRVVKIAASDLKKLLGQVQYDTQSAISTWIGDFKIRQPRHGRALIEKRHLERLKTVLQPGDILLERRNWYLSNAFLPGYWPHGAVYVGTADDLKKRGLDTHESVAAHFNAFAEKDHEGHEHVIIEAISEGVVFSSLEHSIGGADSVAVLRPKLSKKKINEAIAAAFSFAGRPYDFEFDFDTTDMLVCTEVVYRTYGGNSGVIQFPVERIMGRNTMPAINLVAKFDREYAKDDAQLEFIAFVEGDEQTGRSRFHTDVHLFRQTLHRPASTFLQGSSAYAIKSIGPLGWVLLWLTLACGVGGLGARLAGIRRTRKREQASD